MPEVTIKYKNKRALEALVDFAKYFDFSIVTSKTKKTERAKIKRVTILSADHSIDIKEMEEIFSGKNIDAKQLRQEAWQK